MNYKKLWNKLKEEMILRKEDDNNVLSEYMRADEIIMIMIKAEVAESKMPERQLEIPLAGLMGGK